MAKTKPDIDMTAFRAAQIVRKRMRTTAVEVAEACYLSDVSRALEVLKEAGIVASYKLDNSAWRKFIPTARISVGRPKHWLVLSPKLGYLIGVDLGHHKVSATITRADFEPIVKRARTASVRNLDQNPERALDTAATLIAELLEEVGERDKVTPETVIGIGVGLPAPVNRSDKTISHRIHILSTWSKYRPAKELAQRLEGVLPNVAIEVDNGASLGGLGVHSWDALTTDPDTAPRDILYVRVGDGIGAGVVVKGKLVGGSSGFAGEIGHVKVDERGHFCSRCGQRGCVETKAGEGAVIADLAPIFGKSAEEVTIEEAIARNHPACRRSLHEAGWHLGIALGHARTLIDPTRIYIGGAMSESKDFMSAIGQGIVSNSLSFTVSAKDLVKPAPSILTQRPDLSTPELLGAIAIALHRCGDTHIERRLRAFQGD